MATMKLATRYGKLKQLKEDKTRWEKNQERDRAIQGYSNSRPAAKSAVAYTNDPSLPVRNPSAATRLKKQGKGAEYRGQNAKTDEEQREIDERKARNLAKLRGLRAVQNSNQAASSGARKTLESAFKKK